MAKIITVSNSKFSRRSRTKGSPKASPRSVSASPRQSGRNSIGAYGANASPSARNRPSRSLPYRW